MKTLIIINDAPYGTEKAYNALRLAIQIGKDYEAMIPHGQTGHACGQDCPMYKKM
jgi:sulfur relay (sulfurtransferase) complex TusBCD TusD component (DsrE family)